jgi:hypothetical protein
MSTRRKVKDVWLAHLPKWRQDAVGKIAFGEVFLIVTIDRDPGRYVRVEIPADHARSLAADLLAAADRSLNPTGRQQQTATGNIRSV